MVEKQPTLGGFDGNRAGTNFCALPATFGPHHKPVLAPMDQVRALTDKNIAERGMTIITWTVEHPIPPLDFSREKNPIAIKGQIGIF